MANSPQAAKRARQNETRRQHNASQRSRLRTAIKKVIAALRAGDAGTAQARYKDAVPLIDAMAGKGIIHKNKAARHKQRLNHRIRQIAEG